MPSNREMETDASRRDLLRMAVAGGVALGLGVASGVGAPGRAHAQTTLTPDDALKTLMDGNARFTAGRLTSFQEDLTLLAQKTAEKQEPFAAILSCADSRVPVEILFDQTIGHVFVVRVAGNVATPEIIASLEYGTAVLGTRLLMVLGHGACGAVTRGDRGQGRPRPDQRPLRAPPPRRGPGGPRPRRRDPGERPHPGEHPEERLARDRGPGRAGQGQGGRRPLRHRERDGQPPRVAATWP